MRPRAGVFQGRDPGCSQTLIVAPVRSLRCCGWIGSGPGRVVQHRAHNPIHRHPGRLTQPQRLGLGEVLGRGQPAGISRAQVRRQRLARNGGRWFGGWCAVVFHPSHADQEQATGSRLCPSAIADALAVARSLLAFSVAAGRGNGAGRPLYALPLTRQDYERAHCRPVPTMCWAAPTVRGVGHEARVLTTSPQRSANGSRSRH